MDKNGAEEEFQYDTGIGQAGQAPTDVAEQPTRQPSDTSANPLLQWSASEFIDHKKSAVWFLPLLLAVLGVSGIVYLVSREILAAVVILLGGATFATFAYQKPRTLTYSLFPTSLQVGLKSYSYNDFRTFSVIQEGALFSVLLEPVKRFMPPLSIYFAPEDGERIFDVLATHIPHQDRQADPIERLMRKIRF